MQNRDAQKKGACEREQVDDHISMDAAVPYRNHASDNGKDQDEYQINPSHISKGLG
jgi:hypothetical protein